MNPLQDLKDIRTPDLIANWPPAYGWWVLLLLFLVVICLLTIYIVKIRKVRLAKRQALAALQQINSASLHSIPQLNQLLKRVAMTYFPDQNVQMMHGTQWTDFLVNTLPSKKTDGFSNTFESMQQNLYQPHILENAEFQLYSKAIETWIKYALPPNKHTFTKLEQNNV